MISRTLALLMATLAVAAMSAAPAHAGEEPDPEPYPSTECTVAVDNDSPAPGDTITITGEKWDPGATAVISVGGAEVGNATVGEDGTFSFEYTIPSDAEAGDYAVEVDGCEGAGEVLGTTITVVEPAAAEQPRALPATGSSSTEPLVRTGAVLIAAGAVLVYAVRRRNQAAGS
jgi:LPXTG-motif cell wall-anchored protein